VGSALWTFGHSTRSAEETVELLRGSDIARVVDVRSIPGSRHNPQFGATAMAEWLPAAGIDYHRIEALGGRRRLRRVDPAINAGWTNDSFHAYADWTLGEEFAHGLAELGELAERPDARVAIMCAEAVPWRCHRSLIATVLVVGGWRVVHILGPGQVIDHRPGQWGPQPLVRPDGHVVYPPDQGSLFN
jgi:uncharacterized protein (DUF488 family)